MSSYDRHIRQHWSMRGLVHRAVDIFCVLAGLVVSIRLGETLSGNWIVAVTALAAVIYFLAAELIGVYRNWRGATAEQELVPVLFSWGATIAALLVIKFFVQPSIDYTRLSLFLWFLMTPVFISASRIALRGLQRLLRSRGINTRGFAIVGATELGIELVRNVEAAPELGLKCVGFYDDRPADRTVELPEDVGQRIGDIAELVEQARMGEVDMIYITFPMRAEERIRGVLGQLSDSTASVYVVPDFFVFQLLHSRWTNINGLPVVSVFENPFYGVDGLVKRCVDFVLASVALLALALPMAVIAMLIKRSSPGPVFFRQRRYGLDGREIKVWKFRTMSVCEDGEQVAQAQKNDSRVTPLGALLRKTSLDELPQLFNVLEGSMSLVGPRPHASAHNEQYRGQIQGYMLRHKVRPGITGLAQVNGWRGETDTLEKMEKRVECDHQYIREWSLWLDIKILFRTIFVVFSRQNAY